MSWAPGLGREGDSLMNRSDESVLPGPIPAPRVNQTAATGPVWARPGALRWLWRAALLLAIAPLTTACTNAMLSSARTTMAAGNYAQAHQELESALHDPSLKAGERREVKDDLCAAEVGLGAPTYSLWRQHQTCADAAREPGSASAERLAKINAALGQQYEAQLDRALRAGDIGGAVAALRGYERIAPNDSATIARFEHRLWLVVDGRDQSLGRHQKRHVRKALASLDGNYPGLQLMNQRAFKRWVGRDTAPAGVPMVSTIAISGHTLELKVPDDNLKQSALSPEKFARINDAFSVWCQCDGATHVASEPSGLPVYLARFNPQMARSEVLVLPWR
jgi:hypothetical protein